MKLTGKICLGVRSEAGQRWTEFSQKNTNTLFQQQKNTPPVDINIWSIPKWDRLYSLQSKMEKLYTISKNKTGSWRGSDHEILITKSRIKLKKVRKTTRQLKYDLNQIPYNYTVEVRSRFKGLDLIECLKNYGRRFMTLYRKQWSRLSPWKRNAKDKMVVWRGLTNSCKKNRSKSKGEKER